MMIEDNINYNKTWKIYLLWGIGLLLSCDMILVCNAECKTDTKKLWADSKASTFTFRDKYEEVFILDTIKRVLGNEREVCTWIITASKEDQIVKISFPDYKLKRAKGSKDGDCVEIYDGSESNAAKRLAELCDSEPEFSSTTYESSKSTIMVVYKRGEVEGERYFTLKYRAKEVISKADIVRIAACVGGILAAVSFTYLILRATKCCQCAERSTSKRSTNAQAPALPQESARLTIPVTQGDGETGATDETDIPRVMVLTNEDIAPVDSDSDSLPGADEMPPSYESLYLTEEGLPPPDYTPPLHKERHPPRRVHTFN